MPHRGTPQVITGDSEQLAVTASSQAPAPMLLRQQVGQKGAPLSQRPEGVSAGDCPITRLALAFWEQLCYCELGVLGTRGQPQWGRCAGTCHLPPGQGQGLGQDQVPWEKDLGRMGKGCG